MSHEKWVSALSPLKTVIGVSWFPRKSDLSSLYDCSFCMPLCRALCLSFRFGYLVGEELVILLFVCVVGKCFFFMFYFFFLSHLVSMSGL